ncbi:MAG: Rpn family recombination-promoting nuclease/putative transposase [Treponema sp.]|nr:Rpn family recombination-promoting nuclease/putative transposase [Treponema sp.]
MAEKDIVEKSLESYNDVFADIVNGLLFNGQKIVKEDELEAESEYSMYKADNKLHEQERDVAKYWKTGKIRIAMFGFENQTLIDRDMPLRVLSYDGAIYRNQLNYKGKERFPVVTLVLYFGDKKWNKPKNLLDCVKVPKELKAFVNDYRINLFEISNLTDEQIAVFKSDFRIVADYFAHRNKDNRYKYSKEIIKHVDVFFKLMKTLTNDNKFETMYNESILEKGGVNMDAYLTKLEKRSRAEGISQGMTTVIKKFVENGAMTVEQIAGVLQLPVEKVKELAEMKLPE